MPLCTGQPIEIRFVAALPPASGLPVHAGALLRGRCIVLEAALERNPGELSRILTHEVFHFVWVRLGNGVRRSYEDQVAREISNGAAGELGWSSERRKIALSRSDRVARTRRWREYCCESFCDSAAWVFAGVPRHPEFTLAAVWRARRRRWFSEAGLSRTILV